MFHRIVSFTDRYAEIYRMFISMIKKIIDDVVASGESQQIEIKFLTSKIPANFKELIL